MKFKKILSLFLPVLLILSLAVLPAEAAPQTQLKTTAIGREDHAFTDHLALPWPDTPSVDADTAFLVELNSGTVLYAKNAHQQMFPASITKIMTALLTVENVPLSDTLTLSRASVTDLVWGGTDPQNRFYEGQTFSIEDALYALCLDSVNTVGYALAEHISGSLPAFADLMNKRASAAGAVNTHFNNPHGLNDQTHLTTAHDMAKILWAAAENDLYRRIAGTPYYSFTDGSGRTIDCSHGFKVFLPDSEDHDPRCVCGKTGFTSEAMLTRAVYATDGRLDLIAVTMHSDSAALALQDVETLLNYGFNNFSLLQLPEYDAQDFVLTTGSGRSILLTAGEMIESYPVPYLVPNAYATVHWIPSLITEGSEILCRYSYGGGLLTVTYPAWVDDPEAPSTENTQPVLPDASGTPAAQSAEASEDTQLSTEETGRTGTGGLRRVIVIIVLLLLLIAVLYILAEMILRSHKPKRRRR